MNISRIVLAFAMFLITNPLFSQKIPIEYSVSYNKMSNDTKHGIENNTGYGLGIKNQMKINEFTDLLFGVEYNHTTCQKYLIELEKGKYLTDVNYVFDYLSLPVSAKIGIYNFFLEGGAYFDLSINAEKSGFHHNKNLPTYFFHDNIGFPIANAGFLAGIGFELEGRSDKFIKCTYHHGLMSMGASDLYNRFIQLSIGINVK